jgi:hypothetical protein
MELEVGMDMPGMMKDGNVVFLLGRHWTDDLAGYQRSRSGPNWNVLENLGF